MNRNTNNERELVQAAQDFFSKKYATASPTDIDNLIGRWKALCDSTQRFAKTLDDATRAKGDLRDPKDFVRQVEKFLLDQTVSQHFNREELLLILVVMSAGAIAVDFIHQ